MDRERQERVFARYAGIYEEIFRYIYPSKNSTGFGERNLSVNFSKAYEAVSAQAGETALSWFEFQFQSPDGTRNDRHVDAVILNDTASELLIVESKRFSLTAKKIREIREDMDRIRTLVSELRKENEQGIVRIDMARLRRCYGVILADVWPEKPRKANILKSYQAGVQDPFSPDSFLSKYACGGNGVSAQAFPGLTYQVQALKEGEWTTPYYLTSFLWQVF